MIAGTVAATVAPVGPRKPADDPKDAQVILRMLEIGAVQVFHDPLVAGTCDIQELSKTYGWWRVPRSNCGTAS